MSNRSKTLSARLADLRTAFEAAEGRIPDDVEQQCRQILTKVDERMALSADVTVVALAGATGSGKSSLFNAISGTKLAEPGVRRPTTASAMSASFGGDYAEVLDWLDVPRRHRVTGSPDLTGLILVDLPDHDSTQAAHRDIVDKLVELVDTFIWVVDPQKYADAALHDGYLKPMARHSEVMLVVLNQVDRLSSKERASMVADLRRLLDAEGLGKARLMAASATTGDGVDAIRTELVKVLRAKEAVGRRLAGEVDSAAAALRPSIGERGSASVSKKRVTQLNKTLGTAAGVPVVVEAVAKSWRHRGVIATGWPLVSWLARFRPDPLRALHLDVRSTKKRKAIEPGRINRTSLPVAAPVATARVDSAVRGLATDASEGMPRGWQDAVSAASTSNEAVLGDHLDRAIATTDLRTDRGTGWWQLVRLLQWLVLAATLTGAGWLLLNFILVSYLVLPPLPVPKVGNVGLPTLLALGGVVVGIVLALLSRIGVEIGARSHARRADAALTSAINEVTAEYVIDPVNEELARHDRAWEALQRL